MVRKVAKNRIIIVTSVLVLLLATIGVVALVKSYVDKDDSYVQTDTAQPKADELTPTDSKQSDSEQQPETSPPNNDTQPLATAPDPATVATIDIEPMNIIVAYVKGVGAFEYEVFRAANGTKYVEFYSSTLIGTKCTNDTGGFASIIEKPTAEERSALVKTTTVNEVEYGLSLADATCTSNPTDLKEYQKSFSDAFSLLKQLN